MVVTAQFGGGANATEDLAVILIEGRGEEAAWAIARRVLTETVRTLTQDAAGINMFKLCAWAEKSLNEPG